MKNKNLYTMKQPDLGKKISELRKQKGLTQEELVEKCNINVRTIQRIEAGEVTPRSFTIKTILEVLEVNYDEVITQEKESYAKGKFDKLLKISKENFIKAINLSWIFGIIYLFVTVVEFLSEYMLIEKEEALLSIPVYILIKLISLTSFFFFIRGFIVTGNVYKNQMLEIVAFITLIANTLFGLYAIFSLFLFEESIVPVTTLQVVFFGILTILLGISVVLLHKKLGALPIVVGVFEIIAGFFLLIFAVEIGIAIIFPMQLLEIVLLYSVANKLKF